MGAEMSWCRTVLFPVKLPHCKIAPTFIKIAPTLIKIAPTLQKMMIVIIIIIKDLYTVVLDRSCYY